MSDTYSGQPEPGHTGLSFANVLRECLVCGAVVFDPQERIAALTAEAQAILGWSGTPSPPAGVADLPAALQAFLRETLTTGQPVVGRLIQLPIPGRGLRTLRVSAVPMAGPGPHPGLALLLTDLTATDEFEEKLRRLDRLASIGTLSAGLAHESKNALVAGKTFIDLLLEQHQDTDLAEVVRREFRRLDLLLAQMLRFAGPARPTLGRVRLHEALDRALRLVRHQLEGKGITVRRVYAAASDWIEGDDYQLEQVFLNLLLNAAEAMGANGLLTVSTDAGGPDGATASPGARQLRITIADTGGGVAPAHMAHLFEPFFTTKEHGTGLGLSIARRIVQDHGGTIAVENEPGQGAAFVIVLPALPADSGAGPVQP